MHRNLRWLMGLVAPLMVMTLLAACGGAAPNTSTDTQATTGSTAATSAPAAGAGGNLQIIWFAWQPCQALGELVKSYQAASVEVRCVPIGQWREQIFTDFAAKGGADLVILDSQHIGEAVAGSHIIELTDWMQGNVEVDDYVPAALSAYGEYPAGSKRYYGVALEGDTQMLVYRKDLFDNPAVKDAFKAKTGKDLAVPAKWTDLLTIAQFFKETPDDVDSVPNGYVTFWCGTVACYDQVATVWNQIAWSWGGEIWDPATYKVEGILNSDTNVEALKFTAELFKTSPEGAGDFDFDAANDAICSGSVAMETIWFGFGPVFLDETGCKESKNLAFDLVPGEQKRVTSLGGMGIHVSSYAKDKDAALAFLKWLQSEETQLEWAKLGGFSARKSILESDTFKNATPYNPIFAQAYLNVKDFWNVPEYSQMLPIQMEQLNLAITGQLDPKQALDTIASEQQQILDKAYPNGPPK